MGAGRRTRAASLSALAVLLVASACATHGPDEAAPAAPTATTRATTTTTTTTTTTVPQRSTSCPMVVPPELDARVHCGTVSVPEDRSVRNGHRIALAYAVIRSTDPHPAPDPVVEIEGGPGFGSLGKVESYAKLATLDHRDLVLWDQRGVGHSERVLSCPDETKERACFEALQRKGIHLDGYNSVEGAADLDDLRAALGYDTWNVRAISYGTVVAIDAIRLHPEHLRTVVLDSVEPPDEALPESFPTASFRRAFDELAEACDRATCLGVGSDLRTTYRAALAKMQAMPWKVPGGSIDGPTITDYVFDALYNTTALKQIPRLLREIAATASRDAIRTLYALGELPAGQGPRAEITNRLTVCADRGRLAPGNEDCDTVPVSFLPSWHNQLPAKATVRVLVTAGQMDPITPPAGSKRVARALGARFVELRNTGHGATRGSPCGESVWKAFVEHPTVKLRLACVRAIPPISFD